MLEKELLSGLWARPECRSFAVIFTLDHVSLSCFTALVLLTTFVATRRCRCLFQSVRVNVMPGWLLFVISGILAGGIPGFCIELCCFLHPLLWPLVLFSCLFVFVFWLEPILPWHTSCHHAWTEMILSYHLLPDFILVTHKLVPVTSLLCCVCCFWFVWFWFCVCLCFCFFVWWFLVFLLLCFALRSGDEMWQYTGLCNGPPPVYFWGHSTAGGLRTT